MGWKDWRRRRGKSRWKNEELDYAIDFVCRDGLHVLPRNGGSLFMSENSPLSQTPNGPLGEIPQAPSSTDAFLDKHQVKLIALAALLAVAAAVYVVYQGVVEGGEEAAGIELSEAVGVAGYQSVVKNHAGTRAAFSAKVLLAEEQWKEGRKEDSIGTLENFVEVDRDHPAYGSAASSLAIKLASVGRLDEATELLNDLTKDPQTRYLAPFAWISLGDIHAQKGEIEEAEKAYSMVEAENPGSPFVQDANNRLLLVKAQAPEVVAAPPEVPDVKLAEEDGGETGGDESTGALSMEDMLKAATDGSSEVNTEVLESPVVDEEGVSAGVSIPLPEEPETSEEAEETNEADDSGLVEESVEDSAEIGADGEESAGEAVEVPETEISE